MKKRYLYMLIIAVSFIVQYLLDNFVFDDFPPLLSFLLLVPFYVIIAAFQHRYKLIRYISWAMIVALLANVYLEHYIDLYELYMVKIRIVGGTSFFMAIVAMFLAFLLMLYRKPADQLLKASFAVISVLNYALLSYFYIPFRRFLEAILALASVPEATVAEYFQLARYIAPVLILIFQLIIIHKLDKKEKVLQ